MSPLFTRLRRSDKLVTAIYNCCVRGTENEARVYRLGKTKAIVMRLFAAAR